jgi:hypothetical protein
VTTAKPPTSTVAKPARVSALPSKKKMMMKRQLQLQEKQKQVKPKPEHPVMVARREAAALHSAQMQAIDQAQRWLRDQLAELDRCTVVRQRRQVQAIRDMGRLQGLALTTWKQVGKASRAEERFAQSEEFERAIAAQERKQTASHKYQRAVQAARKSVAELWSLFQVGV